MLPHAKAYILESMKPDPTTTSAMDYVQENRRGKSRQEKHACPRPEAQTVLNIVSLCLYPSATGTIPAGLGTLDALEHLDLSNNKLSGEFRNHHLHIPTVAN